MKSYNDIVELREMLYKLSRGVDPTTDRTFSEDTILDNPVIKKALNDTAGMLNDLRKIIEEPKPKKKPFSISAEDAESLAIEDDSITISHLVHIINEQVQNKRMKKLRATAVTFWLTENDYLKLEYNKKGDCCKVPTDKGCQLGITKVLKSNAKGKMYSANLYDSSAQRFIVDNLPIITQK